jgi:hypothetical protein
MLSGVTNSTVGRVVGLDALVDRLARSPPASWPSLTQEIQREVLNLKGPERAFGDMYLEAKTPLFSTTSTSSSSLPSASLSSFSCYPSSFLLLYCTISITIVVNVISIKHNF